VSILPTRPISQAKAELSALMDQVVREHHPTVIERRREAMVALSLGDLRALLTAFRFEPRLAVGRKEAVATLDELGLVGGGRDPDAALDDLLAELRDYVTDFLSRYAFYMQTDRRTHAPWVLRFALTPAEEQRALLVEEPREERGAAQ
jgi:PHD/YefM family antitoxin component YafN of YafNO toxin-antitoxin module